MHGRIPGRLLAQYSPWHAQSTQADKAYNAIEENDLEEA
jgi:hypothetical protein